MMEILRKGLLVVAIIALSSCASKSSKETKKSVPKGIHSEEISEPRDSGDALSHPNSDANMNADGSDINTEEKAKEIHKIESPSWVKENFQNRQYRQIEKRASESLTLNPKDHIALNALGLVYHAKGEYQSAHYMFIKAIDSQPKAGGLYNNLGTNYLARKMDKEAMASFKKCLEVEPAHGPCAAQLGSLYLKYKDPKKAMMSLEIAKQQGVNDITTTVNYATALMTNGKIEEARSIYEEAMKTQNNQPVLVFNYAILLIDHMQNFKEGGLLLDRLKFLGPVQEMKNKIIQLEKKVNKGLQ